MEAKIVKSYCHYCGRRTNHEVLFTMDEDRSDEDYYCEHKHQMVKCCGCDSISYRKIVIEDCNVDYNDEGELEIIPQISTYPHQEGEIKLINIYVAPLEIRGIYLETVTCINQQAYRLAAAGCRATIEAICLANSIQGKTLEAKINNLQKKGIITIADRDKLHAVRFMGNDSIHQMQSPKREELMIVFEIVQSMIDKLYILEWRFRQLSQKPIKKMKEFINVLDENLKDCTVGKIDTLRNFLMRDRRVISEDLPEFERQLQELITKGEYKHLSICPAPPSGKQQYKVENVE